jgi:transposase
MELRRKKATELYGGGMTQQGIADQLNVSQSVISEYLGNLSETDKSKRPKTATNPRGAGRPKGSKSKTPKAKREPKPPGVKQAQRSIDLDADTWEQVKARAAAAEIPAAQFIGALLTATINPEIDLKTLSKTAQNKVGIAIRQHQKRLDREFELKVQAEVKLRNQKAFPVLDKIQKDAYANEKLYREFMQKAKKIMTVEDFSFICSCLHPDSRDAVTTERLNRAFQMFRPKKFALTGEK